VQSYHIRHRGFIYCVPTSPLPPTLTLLLSNVRKVLRTTAEQSHVLTMELKGIQKTEVANALHDDEAVKLFHRKHVSAIWLTSGSKRNLRAQITQGTPRQAHKKHVGIARQLAFCSSLWENVTQRCVILGTNIQICGSVQHHVIRLGVE
jgi:hypothetical protein